MTPPTGTALRLPGKISKNCTSDGWSETFPDFADACGYEDPEDKVAPCPRVVVRPRSPRGWHWGRGTVCPLEAGKAGSVHAAEPRDVPCHGAFPPGPAAVSAAWVVTRWGRLAPRAGGVVGDTCWLAGAPWWWAAPQPHGVPAR